MPHSIALLLFAAGPIREPLIPLWAMELFASLFLFAWLACVGACVGSFLNVVVYRLPRKMSLVHPGSFCPHCGHAIRLRDNIPLLSWLSLRARCRDCRGPISSRYFLVELAVATIFLGVALVETKLTTGFPTRSLHAVRALLSPLETLPFWATYALDVILLATLLGAALIDMDRFPTPAKIFVPVIVAGLVLAILWPAIGDGVGLAPSSHDGAHGGVFTALIGWLVGAAAGGLFQLAWRCARWRGPARCAPTGMFVALGVVCGAETLLEAAAAATVLFAFVVLALRIIKANVVIPLAGVLLVTALPPLLDLNVRLSLPDLWPAEHHGFVLALCAVSIPVFAVLAAVVAPPQYFAPPALQVIHSTSLTPSLTTTPP